MQPAPVRVKYDGGGLSRAATPGTFLRSESWMGFRHLRAYLLATHLGEEGEGDESKCAIHDRRIARLLD